MFEQVFKNIDVVRRKEAGCTTELDYTEQTSWRLLNDKETSMNSQPIDFEPFRELAAQQQLLARQALGVYSQEVDVLIRGRCADPTRIEHLLGGMLDFCFDADILLLFKKLCRYYFQIDRIATAEYVHAYREMWDQKE